MRRFLVISAGPGEWRAALVEDGMPVELRVERGDGAEAGSIHLGRVLRRLPALGAALVDIGGDRPAFLPQSEIFPRGRRLDEGERVVVQIRREAQGGKAARLTTAVALRGRCVELIVGRPGLAGAEALPPEGQALLLRAAAAPPPPPPTPPLGLRILQSAPVEALVAEAATLRRQYDDLAGHAARIEPPARLAPPASFGAALAGVLPAVADILVDEPAAIPEIRPAFPAAAVRHSPQTEWPFDLDALFEEALSPTAALPGGGALQIEPTQAAVMIDVDSGTPQAGSPERTALAVDLAAAAAIARQVRLRNLSGAIVVDFVGLDDRGARERVRAALARALAADPMQPQILGWTRLGHLELVRRRRARPLADALLEALPRGAAVKTAVTVAHEALRAVRREARARPGQAWRITVGPDVAAALSGDAAGALRALEQHFGRALAIAVAAGLERDRFQIAPL